jgi:hypothetical protein
VAQRMNECSSYAPGTSVSRDTALTLVLEQTIVHGTRNLIRVGVLDGRGDARRQVGAIAASIRSRTRPGGDQRVDDRVQITCNGPPVGGQCDPHARGGVLIAPGHCCQLRFGDLPIEASVEATASANL